ncbi:MAG: DUF456 domain-containing protein [Actinomycetota bacterium]
MGINVSDTELTVIVGLVMVVGLAGTVIPVLPGLLVIWLAALGYGFGVGWSATGIVVMVIATLAVGIGLVTGVLIPRRMAEGEGVPIWSQLVGLVAAIVGFFVIPYVGVFIGALAGILGAEWIRQQDLGAAWRSTVAVAKGMGISMLVELGLAMVTITAWAVWAFTVLS